ncbi:MAG: hypothetical protein F6K26_03860 [Moorea sp. SIO2I5]|nr:hypothetical protein [Moorena sp. SIO2I5]
MATLCERFIAQRDQRRSHCINASINAPATMLKVEERASFETGLLRVAIA